MKYNKTKICREESSVWPRVTRKNFIKYGNIYDDTSNKTGAWKKCGNSKNW